MLSNSSLLRLNLQAQITVDYLRLCAGPAAVNGRHSSCQVCVTLCKLVMVTASTPTTRAFINKIKDVDAHALYAPAYLQLGFNAGVHAAINSLYPSKIVHNFKPCGVQGMIKHKLTPGYLLGFFMCTCPTWQACRHACQGRLCTQGRDHVVLLPQLRAQTSLHISKRRRF